MGEEPKNNFQTGRGIQNCCNMLPQIFYFQQNVIRHSKKQERVTHIQKKKRQVTKTACERAQMSDLMDKDFKEATINIQ